MSRRKGGTKRRNKALTVIYSVMGFFSLGYFPTVLLREFFGPQAAMVLAAVAIIPFGMRVGGILKGFACGLGLGVLSGGAISIGLIHRQAIPPERIGQAAVVYALSTALFCGVIAALFAYLGRNRRRRINAEWD